MKASVIITNYNHTDTIVRAVKSVQDQVTNFPFEIIIADDGSEDDSMNQIVRILNNRTTTTKHAYIITVNTHVGMMGNYIRALKSSTGEYIAFCDSDDYWVDTYKLQNQVDFLEKNKNYCGCYSNLAIDETNRGGENSILLIKDYPELITFDKLLCGACIPSPTIMIDGDLCRHIIEQDDYAKFYYWDYPLYLFIALFSDFKRYTEVVTAVFTKQIESHTQTVFRGKRWKYILGTLKIKLFFIRFYSCKFSTLLFVMYRFIRDIYSVIFKRWNK